MSGVKTEQGVCWITRRGQKEECCFPRKNANEVFNGCFPGTTTKLQILEGLFLFLFILAFFWGGSLRERVGD